MDSGEMYACLMWALKIHMHWKRSRGPHLQTDYTCLQILIRSGCQICSHEAPENIRQQAAQLKKDFHVRKTISPFSLDTMQLIERELTTTSLDTYMSLQRPKSPSFLSLLSGESFPMVSFSELGTCINIRITSRTADHQCFPAVFVMSLLMALISASG